MNNEEVKKETPNANPETPKAEAPKAEAPKTDTPKETPAEPKKEPGLLKKIFWGTPAKIVYGVAALAAVGVGAALVFTKGEATETTTTTEA